MCAIIGASAPEVGMIQVGDLKTLYLMAESRGGHACGFTDGKVILKSATNSYEYVRALLKQPKFPKNFSSFIGHTRYATIGDKDDDANAHPFAKKGFIGVHNGSIFNYKDLQEILGSEAKVDSEVLYEAISKYGLKRTLPLLNGILALSYYNLKNKAIYLYKFEKPLSYGYKNDVLFWASLPEYLEAIDCEKITEMQEHTLYKVEHGKITASKNMKKTLSPTSPRRTVSNNITTIHKEPVLNIFTERIHHLKSFKMKSIDSILKEKEDERIQKAEEELKKEKEKKTEKSTDRKIKSNNRPHLVFESEVDLSKVPMHAKFFNTDTDDKIFMWFCSEVPGLIYIYNVALKITDGFDLNDDEDLNVLQKRYSNDMSDVLQEIIHEYSVYQDTYDVRQELENDKKETVTK